MRKDLIAIVLGSILTVTVRTVPAQTLPCLSTQSFRIVVLGSSTAAGSGPSHPDSAWVNRYRKHLQSINPSNEVINLARGGTTTYQIMPDGFVPSLPGRPLTDTARNITKAIALNADGIIVNMPSNDAARGFGPAEQLANFDSLTTLAAAAGIPIWICTTQPRNGLSVTATQWQIDVKDSILSRYGNFAVNFWDTFATASGTIDTTYDSGDGIHMNNAAHAILAQRIIDKNILLELFQAVSFTDYSIHSIEPLQFSGCGNINQLFSVVVSNNGHHDTSDVVVRFKRYFPATGTTLFSQDTIQNGLTACETDTLYFKSPLHEAGDYEVTTWLAIAGDSIRSNDTLSLALNIIGTPELIALFNDTVCKNDSAQLMALTTAGDTLLWYDLTSTPPQSIGHGPVLDIPKVEQDLTYHVQAVRGPLYYTDSLHTTYSSNNDWNGVMFDLIGHDDLILDSFALKVFTTGKQVVDIYHKNGSYKGHETNAASWNLISIDTVNVNVAHSIVKAELGTGLAMHANDTFGIYIKLQNHLGKLSYMTVSQEVKRELFPLEIITGSSITHNWGGSYFPRDWNGTVFYHYGNNPLGRCHSELTPVLAIMDQPLPNLGGNHTIHENDSFLFHPGNYAAYQWSTGDTSASLLIRGSEAGIGTHFLSVEVSSRYGCQGSDSITFTVVPPTNIGLFSAGPASLSVFPNPTSGKFSLDKKVELKGKKLMVLDALGRKVYEAIFGPQPEERERHFDLSYLETGCYTLILFDEAHLHYQQLIIRQ